MALSHVVLVALTSLAYYWGRRKSHGPGKEAGDVKLLHSRPSHHGFYMAPAPGACVVGEPRASRVRRISSHFPGAHPSPTSGAEAAGANDHTRSRRPAPRHAL